MTGVQTCALPICVDLLRKLGEPVEAGDTLYRVHACFEADFEFACGLIAEDAAYRIGPVEQLPPMFAEF